VCFLLCFSALYYYFQLVFRRVNREVKRFDSTSRSPLFAHFSETLSGLPTIRAYGQDGPFVLTNEDRMDTNNRFYFLISASQRWLGTRLESLGACILCITAIIATSSAGSLAPGMAGLSLSYAMQVTNWFSFMLRQSVESENYMNSCERAKHYTDGIVHEAVTNTDADNAPSVASGSGWPSRGDIRFTNTSMRYREGLKLVLDDVSFFIQGGTRVGIVGRTGAGQTHEIPTQDPFEFLRDCSCNKSLYQLSQMCLAAFVCSPFPRQVEFDGDSVSFGGVECGLHRVGRR
jgi:ABC-type multidrug transport system fused ATPase/permease subunit